MDTYFQIWDEKGAEWWIFPITRACLKNEIKILLPICNQRPFLEIFGKLKIIWNKWKIFQSTPLTNIFVKSTKSTMDMQYVPYYKKTQKGQKVNRSLLIFVHYICFSSDVLVENGNIEYYLTEQKCRILFYLKKISISIKLISLHNISVWTFWKLPTIIFFERTSFVRQLGSNDQ